MKNKGITLRLNLKSERKGFVIIIIMTQGKDARMAPTLLNVLNCIFKRIPVGLEHNQTESKNHRSKTKLP